MKFLLALFFFGKVAGQSLAPSFSITGKCMNNITDFAVWSDEGGGFAANLEYCTRGAGGCFLDAGCIELCFQEAHGYSAECSICFGALPVCTVEKGCLNACITDSLGEECATCNFPCQVEFLECSGFPTGNTITTFAPTPSTTQQFCPEDVFECPDGSYLIRDPERGCEFFGECSDESSVVCPADVFDCRDGSYLSRDPERGCEFGGVCSTDESVTAAPTTTATTLSPSASSQPTIGATTVRTSMNPIGDLGTNMTLAPSVTTTVGVESTTIAPITKASSTNAPSTIAPSTNAPYITTSSPTIAPTSDSPSTNTPYITTEKPTDFSLSGDFPTPVPSAKLDVSSVPTSLLPPPVSLATSSASRFVSSISMTCTALFVLKAHML